MNSPLSLEDPHEVFDYYWHVVKSDQDHPVAILPCMDDMARNLLLKNLNAEPGALFHLAVTPNNEAVAKCLGIMTVKGPVIVLEHYKCSERYNIPDSYTYSLVAPEELSIPCGDLFKLTGLEIQTFVSTFII